MTLFSEILFTPRLHVRKMQEKDVPILVAWSNKKESFGKYLSPENTTEDIYRERIQSGMYWSEKDKHFIIESREGVPLGTSHYWLRPEREECAVAQIKIAEPAERNKGYGTEAQKYLIINLFERVKVAEVEMYTDINNKAQQRCLAKLGFELIESLNYEDHQINRLGHLYRLTSNKFNHYPVYQYHYE